MRASRFHGPVAPAAILCLLLLPAAAVAAEPPDCSGCHEVSPAEVAASVHGGFECTDCHAEAAEVPHETPRAVDCAACHGDVVEEYRASVHGKANGDTPGCASCHGGIHTLRPGADPESPVHPARLAETCGSCHSDPEVIARYRIPVARPLEAYRGSVHARAVAEDRGGATCNDCHGSHAVFGSGDPRSTVFHGRVPETCGRCHAEITAAYRESVHGVAAAHGAREAPVCTDCHGEHHILSPEERGSPVFPTNIPLQTCGRCHADIRLSEKYGLPAGKVPAYEDSYHGLASRAGAQTVAHCASCHGVHDIQPSSDERSHVHPANLAATCGRCHPGAGRRFSIGPVHVVPTEARFTAVYVVRAIYLPLIWLTVGAMLAHNLFDLRRKARGPLPPRLPVAEERMSVGFRIAHGMTLVSFLALVWTGFALTYPEAWWARPLLLWEGEIGFRALAHRVAAAVLLAALGFHGVHLAVSRRARRCIAAMRPRREDLSEVRERLAWYLGRRPRPPATPRIGYVEKVEYLAFLWGMAVMTATGLLLWLEAPVLRWLPKWTTDVATAIHFYEAILASLAILVWHLYWVIFDPVVYPMDTAWWTGRSPAGRAAERRAPERPDAAPAPDRKKAN
jgi:Ni,Fe-hydrogenase I cytochrome b subunit